MDITVFSLFGFSLLRLVLWLIVIILGWNLVRKLISDFQENDNSEPTQSWELILWSRKWTISIFIIVLFSSIFYTQMESAFRPKTIIQSNSTVLDERMSEIDNIVDIIIPPAEGDKKDASNLGYSEKNASENEQAKEAFKSMK